MAVDIFNKMQFKINENKISSRFELIKRAASCSKENQSEINNNYYKSCVGDLIKGWRAIRTSFFEDKNDLFLSALAIEFSWVKYYYYNDFFKELNTTQFHEAMNLGIFVNPTIEYLEKNVGQAVLLGQWQDGEKEISVGNYDELGIPNSFNMRNFQIPNHEKIIKDNKIKKVM